MKTNELISCRYFRWRLFERAGVFYADGRMNRPPLGKHSLGTRNLEEAYQTLRVLDRQLAVERDIAKEPPEPTSASLPVAETWQRYLDHVARPAALGGAGPKTLQRYSTVRDKSLAFFRQQGIEDFQQVTGEIVESYATHLDKMGYSTNTIYLECTTPNPHLSRFLATRLWRDGLTSCSVRS